jgi:diguanylate cyclase (GGDEF) domain
MMIHMSDLDASYTDALTGLGNRRLLEEKLDKWFADSSERIICGVMLSVENLRDINYHVGRVAGDETLCNIAKLFENLSNSHILTVRYDSNRFANVWTAKSPEEAEQISSEIERLVTGYNMSQPSQSKVHFTLGSYGCSNKDTTKDEFVSIGDNSRYKMRKELDMIIDRALRENRFSVFYQPIWSINENRFICAEALLRLEDDEIGHYSPSAIIPAAEKSGAIIRIGEYVLNEVCRFMKSPEFERLGLDFMEINLSVVECMQENLTDSIIETLDSYGIPHNMLNVEITETALLSNKETVQQNLKRLAEEGVTVSLDDYGSGYSNLQRLAQIHFDIVKIDKGVSDNIADETMQIVVRNTIETFKELNLQVVAEGVETKKQLDIYSKFGCDYIQGYYFSKALPKDKFISFIEERNHG